MGTFSTEKNTALDSQQQYKFKSDERMPKIKIFRRSRDIPIITTKKIRLVQTKLKILLTRLKLY